MGVHSIPVESCGGGGGGGGGGRGAALPELADANNDVLGAGYSRRSWELSAPSWSASQHEKLPSSLDLPCHTEWKHRKWALLASHLHKVPLHPTYFVGLHPQTLSEYEH